jgi:putative transposase
MSDYKKLSHTISHCTSHVVFYPKYRYRIFTDEVGEYTRQPIHHLCRQKDLLEVLELNVQSDHIHLVLSIPPNMPCRRSWGS